MRGRPLLDETQSCFRLDIAIQQLSVKVEGRLLPLILGVEVRWAVLSIEHPYYDSKEKIETMGMKQHLVPRLPLETAGNAGAGSRVSYANSSPQIPGRQRPHSGRPPRPAAQPIVPAIGCDGAGASPIPPVNYTETAQISLSMCSIPQYMWLSARTLSSISPFMDSL